MSFTGIESLSVPEISLVKASIYLTTIAIDGAGSLVPPRSDFYRNNGQRIVQKILHAIGEKNIVVV